MSDSPRSPTPGGGSSSNGNNNNRSPAQSSPPPAHSPRREDRYERSYDDRRDDRYDSKRFDDRRERRYERRYDDDRRDSGRRSYDDRRDSRDSRDDRDELLQAEKSKATTIFVGSLDSGITENELRDTFSKFGTVGSVKLGVTKQGRPLGYAFIAFATREDTEKAYNAVKDGEVGGQNKWDVDYDVGKDKKMQLGIPPAGPRRRFGGSSRGGGPRRYDDDRSYGGGYRRENGGSRYHPYSRRSPPSYRGGDRSDRGGDRADRSDRGDRGDRAGSPGGYQRSYSPRRSPQYDRHRRDRGSPRGNY